MTNRELFLRHVAQTSEAPLALEIVKSSGCMMWDKEGKGYLDLISGISVCNVGHGNPKVIEAVKKQLHITRPDPLNPQHNAQLAAATLRHYLNEMQGDLFLALLAYNIGPRNGGLSAIMRQYGAKDFFTIQPYLQHLPRAYPIRVLSAALAFRLWNREGRLPHYQDGQNARYIQSVGIPGLDW
jgi:hypothetical protein